MSRRSSAFHATKAELDAKDKADKKRRNHSASTTADGPTRYGWNRRGGGVPAFVEPAPEWRGTTVQACGLWPFAAGSSLPVVGVPIGRHLITGATVCADPINWFTSRLCNTPSMFVLGRPALGKSSLVRRILTGLADQGVNCLVLGDLKPDYVRLVAALGGQTISIRRDGGTINPLDLAGAHGGIAALPRQMRRWGLGQLVGAQTTVMEGLLGLSRGKALTGGELQLVAAALTDLQPLDGEAHEPITVRDLLDHITARPRTLMMRALVDSEADYDKVTRELRSALTGLLAGGQFGSIFDGQTSQHMELGRPFVFDLSDLDAADAKVQAAVQTTCWAYGSLTTAIAKKLADDGAMERQHYMLVMDELWRILRAAPEIMVGVIDGITRINRELGLGQIMITHTMNDLILDSEKLTKQAWGFVERSSLVFLGGLAAGEFGNLTQVFALSKRERDLITEWSIEGNYNPTTGEGADPPGRGRFLLKLGKKPGIPLRVVLSAHEMGVNDTNRRWSELRQPDRAAVSARNEA